MGLARYRLIELLRRPEPYRVPARSRFAEERARRRALKRHVRKPRTCEA
jgi:hypothetical protein